MTLADLRGLDLIYLATPYTHYKMGLEAAAYDAGVIAAKLLQKGFRVVSPIAHSHAIARVGRLDAVDAEFWEWADRGLVEKSDACIVATMDGWEESAGVNHEIATFMAAGKPVCYLDPESL